MDGRDGMFIGLEAAADEEPNNVSLSIIGGSRRVLCPRTPALWRVQFRFHKYSTRNSQPLRQIVGSSFAKNPALKKKKFHVSSWSHLAHFLLLI